jgi:uncharacterized protein YjbI with pentapeptide repeats
MADFTGKDLAGSRFEKVDLTGALFHNVDLTGAVIRGALLVNVDISGEIQDVRINGVDVVPLVEAQLDRRYPDRVKMRPADADGTARPGTSSSGCGSRPWRGPAGWPQNCCTSG